MVDLHDSLRPTGAAPPLPVSEIASRGKRRKRRRAISTAGLAVVTMSIAAIAISSLPGSSAETVTVADESADEPTDRTTVVPATIADTTTTTAAIATTDAVTADSGLGPVGAGVGGGSDGVGASTESSTSLTDGGAANHPMTTPGIRTSTTITSQWDDGYCMQIEVINDTVDQDSWQVGLDLDGTIATLWNATVGETGPGTFVFSGLEDYNVTILAGAVTSFGACVDTDLS